MLNRVIQESNHLSAMKVLSTISQPLAFVTLCDVIKFYSATKESQFQDDKMWTAEEIDSLLVNLTDSQCSKLDHLLLSKKIIGMHLKSLSNFPDIPYLNRITIPSISNVETLHQLASNSIIIFS
jgi:hypothetical protein